MPISAEELQSIRKKRMSWRYEIDKDGQPKYPSPQGKTPDFDVGQLRRRMIWELERMGYKIIQVNPKEANCIIRVYRQEKAYHGATYRMFGAHCYTKTKSSRWKSIDETGEEHGIDFSNHTLHIWFNEDSFWRVAVDSFDTYVKLVKDE